MDTAVLKEATGSAPKPVAGLIGIGVWIMGYGLIAYLRMGFAASAFIALPTMVLAIGFAVLGFVRKERPLWPAMVAISMITIPLCIELLEVATDLLEWLVRQ
jgi:hypothetical protein